MTAGRAQEGYGVIDVPIACSVIENKKSVCSAFSSASVAPGLSQNQPGSGVPFGLQRPALGQFSAVRSGGCMKPKPCAGAPAASIDARAWHEMHEDVSAKPNS